MKPWAALPFSAALVVTLALGGDVGVERPIAFETVERIDLRVAPDGGAPMRGTLAAGSPVTVAVRQGDWALLRSGERWGWAAAPALREQASR